MSLGATQPIGLHRVNRCPDLRFDDIDRRSDLPNLGDGTGSGPRIPSRCLDIPVLGLDDLVGSAIEHVKNLVTDTRRDR